MRSEEEIREKIKELEEFVNTFKRLGENAPTVRMANEYYQRELTFTNQANLLKWVLGEE